MDTFAVDLIRGICKSYFDFIRNLAIIGALIYVAEKTGSTLFEAVYWISVFALLINIHFATFGSWWIRQVQETGRISRCSKFLRARISFIGARDRWDSIDEPDRFRDRGGTLDALSVVAVRAASRLPPCGR